MFFKKRFGTSPEKHCLTNSNALPPFARVCRGKDLGRGNKPITKIYTRDARPLHYVENNDEDINFQYDSQIFSPHPAIKPHQSYNPGVSPIFTVFKTHIMIEGKSISCLIDTGCSTNIINFATYQYLKRSTKIQLKTKVSLVTYGATKESTNLKTLGTIRCLAESNDRLAEDVFFVVNTTAVNLIGGNLALRLNLLTLNVHLVSTKEVPVATKTYNYKNKIPKHLHSHVQKYKKVFQGIGRFNGDKIKLHINKMKVVNIALQFTLPQTLISRGFTRRTVLQAPAFQQKGINRLMDIYQIWKPKL